MNRFFFFVMLLGLWGCESPRPAADKVPAWGKQGYDLPIVDLDPLESFHVVVDREAGQYLGHPTTVLLDDGQTILCVYPKGHGQGGIVMKKSVDGGLSWSGRLSTPDSWQTSREVPTIYQTVDASGKKRLILFSGCQDWGDDHIRMSVSEDQGQTWTELEDIGDYAGIVAMSDCVSLARPGHYMASFHRRGPDDSMILFLVYSTNGGLSWGEPVEIYRSSRIHVCEAGVVLSPDRSEMALLLRENSRNYNSQIMFSSDEGQTWTPPRPMPGALCGDRHQAVYLPDGRLLIQFRDITPWHRPGNFWVPTYGDWSAWVGTWDDLKNGYEGAFRIRMKDNKWSEDTGYPAGELLPDGTIVCTTYGHWERGEQPYIRSVRFTMEQIDALVRDIRTHGQPRIANDTGQEIRTWDPAQPELIFQTAGTPK